MYNDLIGKPFKNGGRGPEKYDCWGLAAEIFARHGIQLPDYKINCDDASRIDGQIQSQRSQWINCQNKVPTPALVVIRYAENDLLNHVGVYIGAGRFIHTRDKIGVNIDRVDGTVWKRRIEGYYVPGWLK